MNTTAYEQRRSQIEHYFDRTAADAWARLTSNEPVGRIRATVGGVESFSHCVHVLLQS